MAGQVEHTAGRVNLMSFCGSATETAELGSRSRARCLLSQKRPDRSLSKIEMTLEEAKGMITALQDFVDVFYIP